MIRQEHPIVAQVRTAFERLLEAGTVADTATSSLDEVLVAWARVPLAIGVGGGIPARTELFNFLCGDRWLDPHARTVGAAALRIRRGAVTRFRVHHDDGRVETYELATGPRAEAAAASSQLDAARDELASHEAALVKLDRAVPALARRRPTGLGVLLLPLHWLLAWIYRGRIHALRGVRDQVAAAREQVGGAEGIANDAAATARTARDRFVASLRVYGSGGAPAISVREIEIELASGPLAEGLEVIELTGPARASAQVDAVFVVENGSLVAPSRTGTPPPVGAFSEAITTLEATVAGARGLAIGRRFRDKISAVLALLGRELERKEAGFRARIEQLEAQRVTDPAAFTEARLAALAEQITSSLHAILEHASVHLGAELAELQQTWITGLANASAADALKLEAAKLTEQWDAAPRRIGEEVRTLVMGGIGGIARDLYPQLIAPLRAQGLPEEHHKLRAAPVLAPIVMLPALFAEAKLELPGFFGNLFRSFDTRRNELRERTHARLERLQELATAQLLDAEPRLRAAIRDALTGELAKALEHQRAWLDGALTAERAAITTDRARLAPLVAIRDAVHDDVQRLDALIAQHEHEHPAISISSSAAATASLSS